MVGDTVALVLDVLSRHSRTDSVKPTVVVLAANTQTARRAAKVAVIVVPMEAGNTVKKKDA